MLWLFYSATYAMGLCGSPPKISALWQGITLPNSAAVHRNLTVSQRWIGSLKHGVGHALYRSLAVQSGSIFLKNTTGYQNDRNANGHCASRDSIKLSLNSANRSVAVIKLRWRKHKSSWRLRHRANWLRGTNVRSDRAFTMMT